MSNLYGIVPKLLTWIIVDEADLDLPCGVCAWCDELRTTTPNSSSQLVAPDTHTPHVQI